MVEYILITKIKCFLVEKMYSLSVSQSQSLSLSFSFIDLDFFFSNPYRGVGPFGRKGPNGLGWAQKAKKAHALITTLLGPLGP